MMVTLILVQVAAALPHLPPPWSQPPRLPPTNSHTGGVGDDGGDDSGDDGGGVDDVGDNGGGVDDERIDSLLTSKCCPALRELLP